MEVAAWHYGHLGYVLVNFSLVKIMFTQETDPEARRKMYKLYFSKGQDRKQTAILEIFGCLPSCSLAFQHGQVCEMIFCLRPRGLSGVISELV